MTIPSLASLESDLISSAAAGNEAFHNTLLTKLAELDLGVEDIQAIQDMLSDEREKTAGPGGGFGIGHALALGSILVPAAMAGAKWLAHRNSYDEGWDNLRMTAPDVVARDPARAKAIYDMLHSSAPSVATNPVIASDLMRQMTAMPMVDLGSVKAVSDIGKSQSGLGAPSAGDMFEHADKMDQYEKRTNAFNYLMGSKAASYAVPTQHIAADGTHCVFNWATPAMKEAGITDAFTPGFTGNGSTMDQANNNTQMQGQSMGQSLLPLDSVVRELLAKEMELSTREQTIQQQEMQLQQALQMQQQMGGIYQQQYGVDPNTGMAPEQALQGQPQEDPNAGQVPPEGQDPNAAQPPMEDPNAGQVPPEGQDPNAAQPPMEDPNAAQPPMEDPNAGQVPPEGQEPNAAQPPMEDPNAGQVPPEQGQAPNAEQPPVEGQPPVEDPAAQEQPPVEAPAAGQPPVEDPAAQEQPPMEDPSAAGQPPMEDPAAAQAPSMVSMPQAPTAQPGAVGIPGPDGLHITIPLPSLQIVIKTAEQAEANDALEQERQEALRKVAELRNDFFTL
jgi:hypothetical protein